MCVMYEAAHAAQLQLFSQPLDCIDFIHIECILLVKEFRTLCVCHIEGAHADQISEKYRVAVSCCSVMLQRRVAMSRACAFAYAGCAYICCPCVCAYTHTPTRM